MEIYDHNTLHTPAPREPQKKRDIAKIALIVACIVLAVALTVVSVCFAVFSSRTEKEENSETAFASVRASVAIVRTDTMAGSGVVFKIRGNRTYVMTNHHVIENNTTAQVVFTENGVAQAGEVIGYDAYHDIALLKVEGAFGAPVAGGVTSPAVGTRVLSVGNNLDAGIAAFDGIVSRTDRLLPVRGSDKVVPVFAVTSPVNAGMSGGGVFALNGDLIGIGTYQTASVEENGVTRPVDGMSYCVPYAIAERVASVILSEQSGGQIGKIDVSADPITDDDVVFTGLFFSARRMPKGFTIDGDAHVPTEMSEGVKDGDRIERFGSLTVTPQTQFWEIFAEALLYSRDEDSAENEAFSMEIVRGTTRLAITYPNVHKR